MVLRFFVSKALSFNFGDHGYQTGPITNTTDLNTQNQVLLYLKK